MRDFWYFFAGGIGLAFGYRLGGVILDQIEHWLDQLWHRLRSP